MGINVKLADNVVSVESDQNENRVDGDLENITHSDGQVLVRVTASLPHQDKYGDHNHHNSHGGAKEEASVG